MAEGVITLVLDNLVKPAATRIASLLGLKEDLLFLSREFSAIKNVLQDAETRQITDESVRSWLRELKYVAYDLEDLLEEWIIRFGDHQVRNSLSSNLTSLIKHPIRHLKYKERVDEIKRRLEQIASQKEHYQFSDNTPVKRMREERRTDSWVDQTSVIGRDEDKETLIRKLISEEGFMTCGSGSDKVPTIFILGMGGLGKTTLAKSVYNDKRVEEHFGRKCMWVCVGEVFDRKVIMKSMIQSLDGRANDSHQLRERLAEMLKDGPYLLILDDVWNENYLEWEPLLEILNQGPKSSKIVITARNTGVETNIGSAYTHELKGLGEDECLSIFKKIVVKQGNEEEYEPLMDIGREIVGKCGGLPLAVKTVASAVRGRPPTREEWEMVRNSKIWDLKISEKGKEGKEGILPALMLSYTELTPQLKNCFSYCSIFEKDTILKKKKLIKLWVSQGYFVVNDGQREEEEVGEECFGELLARSMLQEPEKDEEDGSIARCKMHDLVHDLAQWVTKEECRVIVPANDSNNNNNALSQLSSARHCVIEPEVSLGDISLAGVENLRTLIYSRDDEPIDRVLKLLKSVRVLNLSHCSLGHHSSKHLGKLVHLRHLDLKGTGMKQLPAASIWKLKELRYLDLSSTYIKTLPKNIGTLSSLRQLNVENCYSLVKLPKEIVSLPHLRVINLSGCYELGKLPEGISAMASLRILNVESCSSLLKLPKEIVSLPHLRVINLEGCYKLEELPEGIFAMANLRRLNVVGCTRFKKLPNGIGGRKDVVVMLDRFPVGRDAGGGNSSGGGGCGGSSSNIRELGGMKTESHLRICNLKEVGSRDEARTAKLEKRTGLSDLVLSWKLDGNEMDDVNVAAADGVLEGLRPPPQLLDLEIRHYPGQTFPSWMGDGGAFTQLRDVKLEHCENCTQLPPLGQLPSLQGLTIAGLREVRRVGREFFGGPSPTFPCLMYLSFRDMRNWSEWVVLPPISDGEEGSAGSPIMPALQTLELFGCPKLEAMPPIFTTSLRDLDIDDSSPILYHSSLRFLPLYKNITISKSFYPTTPMRTRPDYVELNISINAEATELPGGLLHQTALRLLIISHLPDLRSLPEELTQLTDLQQLFIQDCPELSRRCRVGEEHWPRIAHIRHIQIDGRDNIQCLT